MSMRSIVNAAHHITDENLTPRPKNAKDFYAFFLGAFTTLRELFTELWPPHHGCSWARWGHVPRRV